MIHPPHDPVQRVNEKHHDELLAVARSLGSHPEATAARAVRIDAGGIDLELATPDGPVDAHVAFAEPVTDPKRFRAAFRDLTRRAQAELAKDANPRRPSGGELASPTSTPYRPPGPRSDSW